MPKDGRGASAGAGRECGGAPRAPALPDLTGVDLHRLRVMDDPVLLAAVDDMLARPERLAEAWQGDGSQAGKPPS